MTEQEKRELLADTACSYAGCREADGSHRPIIDRYNRIRPLPAGYRLRYTDPWCAAFVSAVAAQCSLEEIVFAECSCDRMIARYQKAGRWQEADGYRPRTGDILFYDWQDSGQGDNRGSADHVGIVLSLSGESIRLIEGNLSDGVGHRSLPVDGKYIRGYGLPDYGGEGAAPEGESRGPSAAVSLPVLRRGDKGPAVRSLQLLLLGRGCSLGPDGADGDFGGNTEKALLGFQQGAGLEADAVAGKDSWTALITKEDTT